MFFFFSIQVTFENFFKRKIITNIVNKLHHDDYVIGIMILIHWLFYYIYILFKYLEDIKQMHNVHFWERKNFWNCIRFRNFDVAGM